MRKLKLLMMLCLVAIAANASVNADGGKHYLKNVATGKYWGAGNSWGTQASLVEHPEYVRLNVQNNGQYTIDSQVSNGGNSHYFGGNDAGDDFYMDSGNAWWLTFTQKTGNQYTIAAGDNYFGYNGATTVLGHHLAASSENALWEVYSEAEMRTMLEAATVDDPVDATWLILDPNFGRNNRNADTWEKWSQNSNNEENLNISGGNNVNNCAESYHAKFYLKQTLTGIPKGAYKMTAQGFYRQDGSDNENLPYFFIGDAKQTLPLKTGSENSMSDASSSFSAGNYVIEALWAYVDESGEVTLGVQNDNNFNLWCIWDNFVLTYYGDVTIPAAKLASFVSAYKEALAAAQAYVDVDMFDDAKTALNTRISSNTLDLTDSSLTEEQLTTATTNLNAAAEAAATSALKYATYTNANTLINGGSNVDLTSLIQNPSFEQGMNGWDVVGGIGPQNNTSFGKTGTYYAEFWQPNGTKSVSQTVGYLPKGLYKMTVRVKARSVSSAKVYAGGIEQPVTVEDAENDYTVKFTLNEKEDVLIGLEAVGTGVSASWIAFDNFQLTYLGNGVSPEEAAAILDEVPTGKMEVSVQTALTEAVNNFNEDNTTDNYMALETAIANANASITAYANANTQLGLIATELDGTNVYNASMLTALQTAYDEGTMTTEEAAAITMLNNKAWRAANTIDDIMMSYWDENVEQWNSYHVNTWSTEGDNDGSNFKVPFYEYWTEDANSLGEKTMTATVPGLLSNGFYKVSALVRVRQANDKTKVDNSIQMQVGIGNTVDVTKGTQVGSSQFYLDTFTAGGTADADGNLTIKFIVAAESNISWLSFKNVKYVEGTPVYAVVGSKKDDDSDKVIFSSGWDQATQTDILEGSEGVYTKTYSNVELDAQTIAYKFIKKADVLATKATEWYPNDNQEISIPVKGIYDITFTFTEEGSVVTGVATKTAEAVTISDKLWATTVTNSALDFSASEVEAYTATVNEAKSTVALEKVDDVQAETGLVLKAASAGTYYIPVTESSTTEKGDLLYKSTKSYWTWHDNGGDNNKFYGLTVRNENAQFVLIDCSAGNEVEIPAGKAFLLINSANAARTLSVVFADEETTTGINAVTAEKKQMDSIYNLNGQRVTAPNKGLYIVNGKKVVLK